MVGRSETIELWPFSQGEIDSAPDLFIDAAFADDPGLRTTGSLNRADYIERATSGGFREAVERVGARRSRFFGSYISDLRDRDVTQLGDIQRRDDLTRLLGMLAGRAATPLSVDGLASGLAISKNTVERYIALFEEVFVVKRVAAWTNSATTRATRARKLVFVDSGVCAHLAGITTERAKRDPTRAGSLIENFVIGEIMRQLSWSNSFARAYHYRTRDGEEVAKRLTNSFALGSGVEIGRGSGPSVVAFGRTRMPPSRPTRWRALGPALLRPLLPSPRPGRGTGSSGGRTR